MSEAAAEFLRLADLLPEPMLLVDAGGVVIASNRPAERLLVRSRSNLRGCPLAALAAGAAEQVDAVLRPAMRTRVLLPGVLTLGLPDGGSATCRCEGALYRPKGPDGDPLILLRLTLRAEASNRFIALSQRVEVLTEEVARRRRLEAALFKERERLRVTLSSIGDAVIVTDTQGCVTFMNGVAERLTGWPSDDALGRPLGEVFVIVNHDTREPVESPVTKVLREGVIVGLANHTVLLPRGDGPELPIDDSGAPVRDDQGRLVGVIMVFHDVSERDALERALRRQTEQLRAADRRKDEFLAMLSHELRNPLAPLSNGVQLLRTQTASTLLGERVTSMMERQLHHLTRLVNDLLDVSRITRGSIVLQSQPMALVSALELALELAQPLIEQQRHTLMVSLPPALIRVCGDSTRLSQVFANLLTNAAKYTPAGGTIELDWEAGDGHVRVVVRDNGVGLPPELLDSIFDLFQQGKRSLDRSQGGLGVGLSITRALLEMHGGHVEAASAGEGLGSIFSVTLPTLPAAAAPRPDTRTAELADKAVRHRVLVVDDNEDAAMSLAMLVEECGHEASIAYHGEQALALYRENGADIVLLDIGLPGMDGYATARALRSAAAGATLRIVAVSGYGRSEDRQLSAEAGFDLHMVKPMEMQALLDLLAQPA